VQNTAPLSTEGVKVYMANSADLTLKFTTDQQRYFLQADQNGNPISLIVNLQANLVQGGDSSGLTGHVLTQGTPVTDATVSVKVTSPDSQIVVGRLKPIGNGNYTIALSTALPGNYNVEVIASDNVPSGSSNNSQYLITTKGSFFISPNVKPVDVTAKAIIQNAINKLTGIMNKYCSSSKTCSLDKLTSGSINLAISLLQTSLSYFTSDGNHLLVTKGALYYTNIGLTTTAIYWLRNNTNFGSDIRQALGYLYDGSYKIDITAQNDASGNCKVSNCALLMTRTDSSLARAIRLNGNGNYFLSFVNLYAAWVFEQNIMGANLKKEEESNTITSILPNEFALSQNYPNPFNPSTTIDYQLPVKGYVTLRIYDVLGRLITTLVDKEQDPGFYDVTWNASKYASGIYIYSIQSGSFISTKKLMLIK
jgi:hypothetical protein